MNVKIIWKLFFYKSHIDFYTVLHVKNTGKCFLYNLREQSSSVRKLTVWIWMSLDRCSPTRALQNIVWGSTRNCRISKCFEIPWKFPNNPSNISGIFIWQLKALEWSLYATNCLFILFCSSFRVKFTCMVTVFTGRNYFRGSSIIGKHCCRPLLTCQNVLPINQSLKRLSQNSGRPPSSFLMIFGTRMNASWYS